MNQKKEIGIITIHSDLNYGAALQAYALNQYLRNKGYDSQIIDYIKFPIIHDNILFLRTLRIN